MAFLKFNKSELVNLSYSLKREIICANKTGAYCNTSIVTCNTRRYHGLLSVPVDGFGGRKHLLLSSLDESLIMNGKQFNLGIHYYDDIYEPRGHKYIVDFATDPIPQITYRVGEILFVKSILLVPDSDQVLIKYEIVEAPSKVKLILRPFLAFRDIHSLTGENSQARTEGWEVPNGMAFCLYHGFPELNMQFNTKEVIFCPDPSWYKGITYSDEARRGFACKEDLFVPGHFGVDLFPGNSIVFSGSVEEEPPRQLKRKFNTTVQKMGVITDQYDQLLHWADILVQDRNHRKMITAGFSWLFTGLLRETLLSLPGLTLYATGDKAVFEEVLDNLIEDNEERFYRRTTQVESPLLLSIVLQEYIRFGADPKQVWKKYGEVVRQVLESYLPGQRKEVTMQPNGLLWAQFPRWALSWMNAYIDGYPVTERAGYQVETNAFWYNSVCFALEMEAAFGETEPGFIAKWSHIRDLIQDNYRKMFWNEEKGTLADYVDNAGQHLEVRPNMMFALIGDYRPVDDEIAQSVIHIIKNELVTSRGIRTLSPRQPEYKGVYEGSQRERDLAYHNGSTRPWLLAPYVDIQFRFNGEAFLKRAEWLTEGFFDDLSKHGVGAFSELYDGDPPHEPHGAIASALSTAALLHVDYLIRKMRREAL